MTTRQQALAEGLKTYTGKVCTKHIELEGSRLTSSGTCQECQRLARVKYRDSDQERIRDQWQRWSADNAQYEKERHKAWYSANATRVNERARDRRVEDPRIGSYQNLKRRATNRNLPCNINGWRDLPVCATTCPSCGVEFACRYRQA